MAAGRMPAVGPGVPPGGLDAILSNHVSSIQAHSSFETLSPGSGHPSAAGKMPAATLPARCQVTPGFVRSGVDTIMVSGKRYGP